MSIKKDSNGYAPSILTTQSGEDYILKNKELSLHYEGETCRHEIYFGTANREMSKANGFWVNLLPQTHIDLHERRKDWDTWLKEKCQRKYELHHSREEFVKLVGRSYL